MQCKEKWHLEKFLCCLCYQAVLVLVHLTRNANDSILFLYASLEQDKEQLSNNAILIMAGERKYNTRCTHPLSVLSTALSFTLCLQQ
jgi:hypothetical protein